MIYFLLVALSLGAFLLGWSFLIGALGLLWQAATGETPWLWAILGFFFLARLSLGINRFAANRWNSAQMARLGVSQVNWWEAQGRDFD